MALFKSLKAHVVICDIRKKALCVFTSLYDHALCRKKNDVRKKNTIGSFKSALKKHFSAF